MNRATEMAMTADRWTVVGIFERADSAIDALNGLREANFTPEQVSVVSRDTAAQAQLTTTSDLVADEERRGAVAGTFLGGLAGWLIGLSAFALPGVGPIVGAGIIGAALTGAGIGAAAGGLIGALGSQGIPDIEARNYEESLRQGHILLTVHTTDSAAVERARAIFTAHGSSNVHAHMVEQERARNDDPPEPGGTAYVS